MGKLLLDSQNSKNVVGEKKMAFWMDPALLIVAGLVVSWVSRKWFNKSKKFTLAASGFVLFVFFFVSIGLFVNLSVLQGAWQSLGAESGTEYMINGIILPLVSSGTSWTTLSSSVMFLSIFLFVLYPFWYWLGMISEEKFFE